MYRKYNTRGGVKWQKQHEAKLSVVFDVRPHPVYCIFHISWVNCALTDLLFYIGRIGSSISDGPEMWYVQKQIKTKVSDFFFIPRIRDGVCTLKIA